MVASKASAKSSGDSMTGPISRYSVEAQHMAPRLLHSWR